MKFQLNSALGVTAMVLIGNLACSAQNSGGDVSSSIKQQGGEAPPQEAPPQASPQRQAALPAEPTPADSRSLSISPPNADQGDTVDVAPERKADPGELFPWDRFNAAGVGHWVEPAPLRAGPVIKAGNKGPTVAALKDRFRQYGYGLDDTDEFDAETEAVVTAFQRHFRPERVDGAADASTVATLARLLGALRRPTGATS